MIVVSSARSVRIRTVPRLVKQVIARNFTDDYLLQKQFYGSKLENMFLGHSFQAIWSSLKGAGDPSALALFAELRDLEMLSRLDTDSTPAALAYSLILDLSNPLLVKYGFDHSEFSAGAAVAIRDTVKAIQSADFTEHCKGNFVEVQYPTASHLYTTTKTLYRTMKKCPSSELLKKTLHPGLFLPFFFATKNGSPHMLTDYTVESAHLRNISTQIQTVESMVIQKLKMDSSVNFENKISYNDFLLRSKRIEEGLKQVLAFMPAMHVLTKRRIIRESILYLAESETNPNFMTKRNIEEYAENNRILKHVDEMFPEGGHEDLVEKLKENLKNILKHQIISTHAESVLRVRPNIRHFYDAEEETDGCASIEVESVKTTDSSIKSNSSSNNSNLTGNDVQIFTPILPYPVGGVIATAEVIFKCSRKNDDEEHLFRWKFQGCISEEQYEWLSTDVVYISPLKS